MGLTSLHRRFHRWTARSMAEIMMVAAMAGGIVYMCKKDVVDILIRKMEDKYKTNFTMESICDGQIGSPYTMVLLHDNTRPTREIIARIYRNEQGKWIIQDNYVALYMEERVRDTIGRIARDIYGNCKVYNKPASMVLPGEYSKDMSLTEFLSRKESLIHIYVYLPPEADAEKKEVKAELLRNAFGKKGYCLKGLICYIRQFDFYRNISEDTYRSAYTEREKIEARGIFLLENKKEYSYLRWS